MTEWIACSERMPGNGLCLVYGPRPDDDCNSEIDIAVRHNGRWCSPHDDDDWITHWMPLPAPPEDKR